MASISDLGEAVEFVGRLRAVTYGRQIAVLLVTLLVGTVGQQLVDPEGWRLLLSVGALYLAANTLVLLLPEQPRVQRVALDVSLLVDAAAIGVLLAVTGGPVSPFSLVIYAQIVALTLVFGWWAGMRAAVLMSFSLAWVLLTSPPSLGQAVGMMQDLDPALAFVLDPRVRIVLLLLGMWFVVVLVAALSRVTERELRQSLEELALLREVNHDLDEKDSLEQVGDGIAHVLVEVFRYSRAVVWLARGDRLEPIGWAGLDPDVVEIFPEQTVRQDAYPLRNAIDQRAPYPLRRVDPRPGAVERLLGRETGLVFVPIATESRLLAVAAAEVPRSLGAEPRLRGRDLHLLGMLAAEAALVLDNARLQAELQSLAVTDALTGLANHRFLQQRLGEELDRLSRRAAAGEERVLSLVLFDLDHFKRINDNFGHPTGDAVLQAVARATDKVLRSSDVVCRYGGEEFAVILVDTPPEQAVRACERIRNALHGLELTSEDGRPLGMVTASFGVASARGSESDRAGLIADADAALYAAKRAGRDQVVHHDTLTAPAHAEG